MKYRNEFNMRDSKHMARVRIDRSQYHNHNYSNSLVGVVVLGSAMILLLPWTFGIPSAFDALVAYAAVIAAAICIAMAVTSKFKPMLGMFSTFLLCWLLVPAIYQLSHNSAAWNDSQVLSSGANVSSALTLNLVTLLSLLVGYLVSARKWVHSHIDKDMVCHIRSSMRFGQWKLNFGSILVLLSVCMLPYVATQKGGFGTLFATRDLQDRTLSAAVNGGVHSTIVEFFPFTLSVAGTLILICAVHSTDRSWSKRRLLWILIVLGFVMTWVYANPIANTRFIALSMLGSHIVAIFWPRSARSGRMLIGSFLVLTIFLYPFAAAINNSQGLTGRSASISMSSFAAFATKDFDGFQQSINAFEFVNAEGHSWGLYFLSALLVFIPRSIWTWKATPASIDVASNHGYSFTNLSLPINAELYIDFGWIGVIVLFFIVGWTFARLDNLWQTDSDWAAAVAFLSLAQVGLIRGPLGSQVPVMVFVVYILGIYLFIVHRRNKDLWPGRSSS